MMFEYSHRSSVESIRHERKRLAEKFPEFYWKIQEQEIHAFIVPLEMMNDYPLQDFCKIFRSDDITTLVCIPDTIPSWARLGYLVFELYAFRVPFGFTVAQMEMETLYNSFTTGEELWKYLPDRVKIFDFLIEDLNAREEKNPEKALFLADARDYFRKNLTRTPYYVKCPL